MLTIIADAYVGTSTYWMGTIAEREMRARGYDVQLVRPDKKSALKEVHKTDVLLLSSRWLPQIIEGSRFTRPYRTISVVASNLMKEFTKLERWAYYGSLLHAGSIPVLNVCHSPHTYETMQPEVKEWFSPTYSMRLRALTKMIPYGVEVDRFPWSETASPLKWVVPMNRVNLGIKQIDLHSQLTTAFTLLMRQEGVNVETVFWHIEGFGISGGPGDEMRSKFDLSCYDLRPQPATREEYQQNIKECGAFLCTSLTESFGLYYLELLLNGSVGVFLDRPWVRSLLPGYRYTVPSAELGSAMLHVQRNWESARGYVQDEVIPMIREKYAIGRFFDQIDDEYRRMA